MQYWLMKSEPDVYSIDDLISKGRPDIWEGCRNYTVRNFMRDKMQVGDLAFFYHSNIEPVGVVGVMRITRTGYPDPTQFDSESEYFDPKAPADGSRWLAVDVEFVEKFDACVTLANLKSTPGLEKMGVTQKFQRLSVMPVTPDEWQIVMTLANSQA